MKALPRPLITIVVCAYNQERFVREAVRGAFSQTYAPLEVLLSDDCSNDRTFGIMQEMAAEYKGPHIVSLHQSARNLGIAQHFNRIFDLARGEMVVANAGDDVSLPHRVEAIVAAWESCGRTKFGVHSRTIHMNHKGEIPGPLAPGRVDVDQFRYEEGVAAARSFLDTEEPVILGCTAAWSRAIFERFGPLRADVVYEDMALGFRARLLGGMAFVGEPLVLYRLHDSNVHHSPKGSHATLSGLLEEERRALMGLERRLSVAGSFKADLAKAEEQGLLRPETVEQIAEGIALYTEVNQRALELRRSPWLGRVRSLARRGKASQMAVAKGGGLCRLLLPR